MGVDTLFSTVLPNATDLLSELVTLCGEFFVGGVLISFLMWAIGFAINVAFHWLSSWTAS